VFRFNHHHQGAYYLSLLNCSYCYNPLKYIVVVGSVVWLHILWGPYWCVCVCVCGALFGMRFSFLHNELLSLQQDLLWFQQDGATVYRAHISMQVLRVMLPDRLISPFGNVTWPTRSPDLTSSGATLQARYKKHVIPILQTCNSKFWGIFKGSLRKCYNVLWQPFHSNCSSVLNNMVVTYKVSYSNNYDSDDFSWT
jgi:hypothetical protein